ncbi:MAG: putative toxin-antitoxin system toxin component, PIN family [Pseudomonadota bacterium]
MRVVLDTNLFLSALLSAHGPPARIVEAWRARRFELVSSLDQIEEFKRAARYEKVRRYVSRGAVGKTVNGLRSADVLLRRVSRGTASPDPEDEYLLSMAIAAGADYLVSGDAALLRLKRIAQTRIVSPRRFASTLARRA